LIENIDDIDSWPKTKTGLLSTAREHVVRLVLKGIPSVRPLLAIMALEKLLENFGPTLAGHVNPMTGRIHASYKVAGAKSGRFTSSDPNLQQLPSTRLPDFRRVIVAAPGNLFVCGNYSRSSCEPRPGCTTTRR
jgi:DNA polymerase I-like protein with 3'-5' exonuclease and polymerase domains